VTTDLTPPPEYDLPRSVRGRRREELLAIVARESARPRRRLPLAPTLVAAAAVAGVIAAGVFGLPAYRDSHRPADPATKSPRPPVVRALTAAETTATLRTCALQTDAMERDNKGRFAQARVVEAFTFTEPAVPTRTWLIGRKPITTFDEDLEICGLDADGTMVDAARVSLPSKMISPVQAVGRNFGTFSLPVARVTVQTSDSTEIDAAVRNGFWFAPIKGGPRPFTGQLDVEDITPATRMAVYPGVRLRGYSATGQLLYDSDRDAHTFAECFPTGGGESICPRTPWQRPDPSR
jgi:hypothetical protein